MARSEKRDDKPDESASVKISLEEFIRTKNLAVTGLATLQSAIQDLSRAYIAHTNTVIAKAPRSSLEHLTLANPFGGDIFGAHPATPAPNTDNGESKKRKRAHYDKNAPKRPATPYFLYMQTARLEIAAQMAPTHTAKEVSEEGTKRWYGMTTEERELWSYRYAINLTRYKEKVKAYKAGLPIPEISDAQAKELYDEQQKTNILHMPPPDDLAHVTDHIDSDNSPADDDTSSSGETTEPPRNSSPPRIHQSRKRQHAAEKNSVALGHATVKTPTTFKQVSPPPTPALEERVPQSSEKDRKKRSRKSEIKDPEAIGIKPSAFAVQTFTKSDTPGTPRRSKKKRKNGGEEY